MIASSQNQRGLSGRSTMPVAMPKTDAARVAALENYAILDTDPEQITSFRHAPLVIDGRSGFPALRCR